MRRPFPVFFLRSLLCVCELPAQPGECDAFCSVFTNVLKERTKAFKNLKAIRNPKKKTLPAGVSLPGASRCMMDATYECLYDFGTDGHKAESLYADLRTRIRSLSPSDWKVKRNTLAVFEYQSPTDSLSLRLVLQNTGGGDDPWSGKVYPNSWHVALTVMSQN